MGNSKRKRGHNPTDLQLKKALDQVEEEHHAIMFLYKSDRQKYGKIVEQM